VSQQGGTAVPITMPVAPRRLAVDASDLWWTQRDGSVLRAAVDPPAPQSLALENLDMLYGIALDGEAAYVTEYEGGRIWRIPKDGGPPTFTAVGQANPWGIAVDARAIDWTCAGDGTVRLLAK